MNRLLLLVGLLAAGPAFAAPPATIPGAVGDPSRPAADKARDADRKPGEMLAFAGVKPGSVVVDFMPGGGYFTRLFSTAVGPRGKVFAYVPDEYLAKSPKALDAVTAIAAEPDHANVAPGHDPLMARGAPPNSIDLVWTSQNYHDVKLLPNVDMVAFNKLVFESLKPGGVYVVLDHAAAAGAPDSVNGTLHRIDPAVVRREVEAAGFRFDGESKLLANAADNHSLRVFDPALRGHTDQFVYRFRKPR